jgi:cytochrome P450
MQEVEYMRQYRQQMETSAIDSHIQTFAQQNEFFDDVRHQMGELIARGIATGLEDAYQQAIWMEPSVREVLLERTQRGGQQTQVSQRQVAAARVGIQSSDAPVVDTGDVDTDDIYETVRQVTARQTSQRR